MEDNLLEKDILLSEFDSTLHGKLCDWKPRAFSGLSIAGMLLALAGLIPLLFSLAMSPLYGLFEQLTVPALSIFVLGAALLVADKLLERKMPYRWRIENDFREAMRRTSMVPLHWEKKKFMCSVYSKRRERFAVIEFDVRYPNATVTNMTKKLDQIASCFGVGLDDVSLTQNPALGRGRRTKEFVLTIDYLGAQRRYEAAERSIPMVAGEYLAGFTVGFTPTKREILAGIRQGFLAMVAGSTGSGKTVLVNNLLLQMLQTYGSLIQVAIIDPKRIGFLEFSERCYLYNEDEHDWVRLLQALDNEMNRRYEAMAQAGSDTLEISSETPFILLVIDELSSLTSNQNLTKQELNEVTNKLIDLSSRMRQCQMGMLLIGQSAATEVIPSSVRANCTTRFALRMAGTAQVKMISGDREEECRADLLQYPGEFYASTAETNWNFVKGRTWKPDKKHLREILASVKADKQYLYCLDWDNPDFLG